MPKRVWVIEAMELGIPDGSKRRRMSKGMQDIEAAHKINESFGRTLFL
jgi:hypothetical protein